MKLLIVILLILTGPFLAAKDIIILPGDSQEITRQDFLDPTKIIKVSCETEPKCHIKYEYVGKKYSLIMPNGKNYAFYKSKEGAIKGASQLLNAKICDRLVLDVEDDNKIIAQ